MVKVLAFSGSTREQSFNKKLVRLAGDAAQKAGAQVTLLDLREYPLPLYDGDLEEKEGLPENALKLKELFLGHDALLISSPEYNSSFSAVLKNCIDWVSRPRKGEAPLGCFTGKVCGLLSASTGALGGMRGLVHLRSLLGNINVLVLPDQVSIPSADKSFASDGSLNDAQKLEKVSALASKLVKVTASLKQ